MTRSQRLAIDCFLAHVPDRPADGCWLWQGQTNNKGYGRFMADRRLAHRFAYEHFIGPLQVGMLVCHHCDTPACVNPAHLFEGTKRDNAVDMVRKGRNASPIGERAGRAKLTDRQIERIRALYRSRAMNQSELAREYGVGSPHISRIVRHETRRSPTHAGCEPPKEVA